MHKRLAFSFMSMMWLVASAGASAGLIAHWPFDDGAGTTATDVIGGGGNGTLTGNPLWGVGMAGGALSLSGSAQYVRIENNTVVQLRSTTNYTMAAWVKVQDTTAGLILFKGEGCSAWSSWFLGVGGGEGDAARQEGNLVFGVRSSNVTAYTSVAAPLTPNLWAHVVATYDGTTLTLYVNGQKAGSVAAPQPYDNANPFYIGGDPGCNGRNWFTGAIDDVRIYDQALSASEIINLLQGPGVAASPKPAKGATDVPREMDLSWKPGQYAQTHDVYFGTIFSDVNAASRANPLGVLISQGQDANAFELPGRLDFGTAYYWRVDEVNAPPSSTIFRGEVWNFTVEPVDYPIQNITATASSAATSSAAANTVNRSGLTGDLHGTDTKTMWLSTNSPVPVWIRYDFDRVYKLQELWVWNHNSPYEEVLGFGVKNAAIEYSTDGTTWTKLGDFDFAQAPGTDGYAHDTTVPFGGIAAKAVRITVNSKWGAGVQAGLSEVRFFYLPVTAREPSPATASTGVDPTTLVLSWRAGREAASHNVYVGTDANAVKGSTNPVGTASTPSYVPADLQLGTTYYWRIDEVNAAASPTTWAGDVWSFSTPDFLVVDDFESYLDAEPDRIFDSWIDGWGSTDNGSQVGYSTAPFAERTTIHGGRQAMPLAYDDTGSFTRSEATRTLSTAQDWTAAGVKTLVVFFHGVQGNSSGQLYVKINSTKVDYSGNSAGLAAPLWKQWNIDLTSMGGLKAVKSLTIGVSGSGKGTLYIDDICLYKSAPAVAQPVDPGTNGLMAWYTMEGDAKDASGHGYAGTLNSITFVDSMTGFGKCAQFNGTTGYVDLGASFGSGLVKSLTNCTAAAWVNYTGTGNVWQRVFDFGSSTTAYVFLSTRNGSSCPRFAIIATGKTEIGVADSKVMSVGWHHVAGVIDASTMTMALYVDGGLAQGNVATTILPKDLGATTQNWLGRSMWSADPYLNGSLDDVRIYNRVLSAGEISYLVGDR